MKVLRVIPTMNPVSGGPAQGIRNSIDQMQPWGIVNEVVSMDDPAADFISREHFAIQAVGKPKGPWQYNKALLYWLLEHLHQYDTVIVHGLWLYHGFAVRKAYQALEKQGKPLPKLFVMPHGMLDPYFQKAEGRKLKALRNWLYWKLIEKKLIDMADAVFFTCQEELRLAATSFSPYRPKRVLNVGYGVPKPALTKTALHEEKLPLFNQPYFLFLSRLHKKKGVDNLIRAYSTTLKHLPENARKNYPSLVLAGPGEDTAYGQQLKAMIAGDSVISEKVIFTGMLTGLPKWSAFYHCEAFILPSHQENFGIAIVEALACGKPVLTTNKVNIWQEIADEKAGFIEEDTFEGTLSLLSNWNALSVPEKDEMSTNAFRCYNQYFEIESAAKRMVQLINEVVD